MIRTVSAGWRPAPGRPDGGRHQPVQFIAAVGAAAGLVPVSGQQAGHVFAYQGSPSRLFVELTAAPASGPYAIRLVTTDNRTVSAGICRVTTGSGSYGRTIDLAVSAIRRVELVQPGSPTLVATLH